MRNLEARREYQRKYQREYWRKKHKGVTELKRTEFDQYAYRSVDRSWRALVPESARRDNYHTAEITSPIVKDLLAGKTLLVDYAVPFGRGANNPFRTLYSYFNTRGYRLRIHVIDDVKNEKYRILIMWVEVLKAVKAA